MNKPLAKIDITSLIYLQRNNINIKAFGLIPSNTYQGAFIPQQIKIGRVKLTLKAQFLLKLIKRKIQPPYLTFNATRLLQKNTKIPKGVMQEQLITLKEHNLIVY